MEVSFEVKAEVFTVYIPQGHKVGFRLAPDVWARLRREATRLASGMFPRLSGRTPKR